MRFVSISLLLAIASPAAAQSLTPQQVIVQLYDTSPELRAAAADVRAAEASVRVADGARVPSLSASATGNYDESFSGTGNGVARNTSSGVSSRVAARYATELGTEIEVGVEGGASWRSVNLTPGTTDTVTIGPNYAVQATIDARQPLLRGAGDDAALAPRRQADAAREAASFAREQTASELVLEAMTAYWELWYAQQALRVDEEALGVAERQYEEQRQRVAQLGTAAPADLLQLASQRASMAEARAMSERTRRTRAIALGRSIGVEPGRAASLVAAAEPPELGPPAPLAQLTRRAREVSSELAGLRAQLDAARQRVRGAADADQPRIDLLGSFAVGGLWNEVTIDGLQLPGGRPAFGGLVGLELELPLGSSQAAAEHEGARADLDAAEARYEARARSLTAEIATLRADLETSQELLALTSETARLARAVAEAEAQRIALGTSTPFALVTAQQSERGAELRRLRAIADRTTGDLTLQHRTGELLRRTEGS